MQSVCLSVWETEAGSTELKEYEWLRTLSTDDQNTRAGTGLMQGSWLAHVSF